jgi:hypothetical protein
MKLGYVTDWFGATISEAKAPAAGVVLYVDSVPTMKKGDNLAVIGVPVANPASQPLPWTGKPNDTTAYGARRSASEATSLL